MPLSQKKYEINIRINNIFKKHITPQYIRTIAKKALKIEKPDERIELGILITDDDEIRSLNKQYRGIDTTTDVLAFALDEKNESIDFINVPDGIIHLGEIIISYPQALRQASENGSDINNEMALLIVHGVLHLLGYDHTNGQQAHTMQDLEKVILEQLSVKK